MRAPTFARFVHLRLLLIGFAPFLVVGVAAGWLALDIRTDAISETNSLLAATVASEVESLIEAPVTQLVESAHFHENPQAGGDLSRSLREHETDVDSILIVEADGTVIEAGVGPRSDVLRRDVLGIDRSLDPTFSRALQSNQPSWSGVTTSITSGVRMLEVGVRVHDRVAIGTVLIDSLLERAVSRREIAASTEVAVIDRTGTVLIHSDSDVARDRLNWGNREPIANALQGTTGQSRYESDGVEYLASTALVHGPAWAVVVQQPVREAMEPLLVIGAVIGLVALATGALIIVGSIFFTRELGKPVAQLSEYAARIGSGEYAFDENEYHFAEFRFLAQSLEHMAGEVRAREDSLSESKSALEVSTEQLEQSLETVQRTSERLQSTAAEVTAVGERERRRLAEELHDRVSQVLAVARMRLSMARSSEPVDRQELDEALKLLAEAIVESRAITTELVPQLLYEIGLVAAIEDVCERIPLTSGIEVRAYLEIDEECLSDEVKAVLFRGARELIMNAVKHSGASQVSVTLVNESGEIILTVADDGIGFSEEQLATPESHGFGLFSLRAGVESLGGALVLECQDSPGAVVVLRFPCEGPRKRGTFG